MALQYILANSVGLGVRVDLGELDDAFIAQGVTVGSTSTVSISGTGSNHAVTVAGSVIGVPSEFAILLGNDPSADSGQRLVVTATGLVSGDFAGALLRGSGALVENRGEIFGGTSGLALHGDGGGTSRILNSGSITATNNAILVQGSTGVALTNTGLISGGSHSYLTFNLGTSIDTITNRGTMLGDIVLGLGNDRYDGRGGTVEGTIFGDAGNDTFLPGAGIEVIDGGAGLLDLLDLRSLGGAQVWLDGSIDNGGSAAGDTYTGIENILGSALGADLLVGDGAANTLHGGGGNDTLSGAGGADRLSGGLDADLLTGGSGDDAFVFARPLDGGDVINDFRNVVGNNDLFQFTAAGFGAGLIAGPLAPSRFQSRADNLAQDADDRFIFRTSDKTLWFDANGNAAGGLTLIADLQATAVVTAADIVLI